MVRCSGSVWEGSSSNWYKDKDSNNILVFILCWTYVEMPFVECHLWRRHPQRRQQQRRQQHHLAGHWAYWRPYWSWASSAREAKVADRRRWGHEVFVLPRRPLDSCRRPLSPVLLLQRPSEPPAAVAVPQERAQVSTRRGGQWGVATYLRVRAVRSKLIKDKRIQEVHMTGHLLHASYLSLLFRVGVFDNQAGGCTL